MLAKRLPSILPGHDPPGEASEVSGVWSVAGLTDPRRPLLTGVPSAAPITPLPPRPSPAAAPCFGPGKFPWPTIRRAVSSDELPEFHRDVLEALRQPLDSYMGHKSRAGYWLNQENGGSQVTNGFNVAARKYWTPDNPTNDYCRLNAAGSQYGAG